MCPCRWTNCLSCRSFYTYPSSSFCLKLISVNQWSLFQLIWVPILLFNVAVMSKRVEASVDICHIVSFPFSLSDECLPGRSHNPPVFHRDFSLSLFPGGFLVHRALGRGCRAAVPSGSFGGRHHAQWEKTRGQQQQRCAVPVWPRGGVSQLLLLN